MAELKNIYGISSKAANSCRCIISPTIQASLLKFAELISVIKDSIEKYFPDITIGMPIKGAVSTKLRVPPIIMVRILWKQYYPSYVQDKNNYFYRSTIRDFYFQLNRSADWEKDPLSLI
jgi:hypothetical protein